MLNALSGPPTSSTLLLELFSHLAMILGCAPIAGQKNQDRVSHCNCRMNEKESGSVGAEAGAAIVCTIRKQVLSPFHGIAVNSHDAKPYEFFGSSTVMEHVLHIHGWCHPMMLSARFHGGGPSKLPTLSMSSITDYFPRS